MKATICNICESVIESDGHTLKIDDATQDFMIWDVCPTCWSSPIILSEKRRTKTRKPRPKVGRPKGRKNTPASKNNGADTSEVPA